MRVLQITAYSGWGCTGRIAVGIHNALVAEGHESQIAWGRKNTAPENLPTIKIGNKLDQQIHGLYTRVTDKCGFGSKRVTRDFLKQIDDYKPDLIQLHILHGYYINLELLFKYIEERNIPTVWTFHDCWAFTGHCPYFDLVGCEKWKTGCSECPQKAHHPTSWVLDNSKWNWEKKKELFTSVNNMTIVTPSEWLAGLVKQSFLKECKVEVINNGINLNNFKPQTSEIRDKYNLGDSILVLGVSSTWAASKGLDDFIRVSRALPSNYKIILVGVSAKQKEGLPQNIVGIERTDNIRELAALYSEANVFVNPTYEDNFPTTNIEALACGTPVIAYRTGGAREAAGNVCGKIIEKGNVPELVAYLKNKEWEKFSADSCVKYSKQYDEKKCFAKYVGLYQRILEEDR